MSKQWIVVAELAVVTAVLAACGTSGGSESGTEGDRAAPEPACDVLLTEVPAISDAFADELTGPGGSTAGDAISWLLLMMDTQQSNVRIYLPPGSSPDDLTALDQQVRARPGVLSTRVLDLDETYAAFRRLFAGQQEMLDDVRPEDLPMSVRAEVAHGDAADLVSWARAQPTVYEAREAKVPGQAVTTPFTREAERDEWSDLAARLSAVEGDPAWATTAGGTISAVADDGQDARVSDPDALTDARLALDEVFAGCEPG